MKSIYILSLVNNKYYVGVTNNIERRIKQHIEGSGSEWTKLHKFVKISAILPQTSPWDEDLHTKQYMLKYGIDNVRGGSYTQIVLPRESLLTLSRELRTANNTCLRCGRNNHFVSKCYASSCSDGGILIGAGCNKSIFDKYTTSIETPEMIYSPYIAPIEEPDDLNIEEPYDLNEDSPCIVPIENPEMAKCDPRRKRVITISVIALLLVAFVELVIFLYD